MLDFIWYIYIKDLLNGNLTTSLSLFVSNTSHLSSPPFLSFSSRSLQQTIRGSTDTNSMGATSKSGSSVETTPTASSSCYLTARAKYLSDNHVSTLSLYLTVEPFFFFFLQWCDVEFYLLHVALGQIWHGCFFLLFVVSCSKHK